MKSKNFTPPIGASRLKSVGNVHLARVSFFEKKHRNLDYLLRNRYLWMKEYIQPEQHGLEIGAGAGFSRVYFEEYNYLMTDLEPNPWIDQVVNAESIPLPDCSLDYIFESNVLHHVSKPMEFLLESFRVLKPGGVLLIQDVWGSSSLKFLLRIFKTEGYSYDVDVFDRGKDSCDPNHLWAGNNVIPNLLFQSYQEESGEGPLELAGFSLEKIHFTEFFVFPISGGVTSKFPVPQLPMFILNFIHLIDTFIVSRWPNKFALQTKVVLRKPLSKHSILD